jgi:hypothetical protein
MILGKKLDQNYPELVIMLVRIYLAIPATSVSAERSFSVLERIKNWLRSTMGQKCGSSLGLLAIEKELALLVDFKKSSMHLRRAKTTLRLYVFLVVFFNIK